MKHYNSLVMKTTSITMNGNSGGFTIVDNGRRICMKDLDGNDCNANFTIVSTNNGADHAYHTQSTPPPGYVLTKQTPVFWVLKDEIKGVTVKHYSDILVTLRRYILNY